MKALRENKYSLGQVPCGSTRAHAAVGGLEDGGRDLSYGGEERSARQRNNALH